MPVRAAQALGLGNCAGLGGLKGDGLVGVTGLVTGLVLTGATAGAARGLKSSSAFGLGNCAGLGGLKGEGLAGVAGLVLTGATAGALSKMSFKILLK